MSVQIILGDCIEEMRKLPAESVHCCVTSPPYYGLRDYGPAGQIGLEATPAEFIAKMVSVFAEVHRVLRKDGTCWVNMGDSYAGSGRGPDTGSTTLHGSRNSQKETRKAVLRQQSTIGSKHGDQGHTCYSKPPKGWKSKDMYGMPWRLAFALQDFGWYLRQDIIWHKPNPMPESCNDRCTKAHEYIFLLSKSARYYYDKDAIKEKCSDSTHARVSQNLAAQEGSHRANGGGKTNGPMRAVVAGSTRKIARSVGGEGKRKEDMEASLSLVLPDRNKRSVWTIPTFSYREAHFATYPPALIRPCILAGCPAGGTVLDPFGGSGTTGEVAEQEGRNSILIELNPEYIPLIKRRTAQQGLSFGASFDLSSQKPKQVTNPTNEQGKTTL